MLLKDSSFVDSSAVAYVATMVTTFRGADDVPQDMSIAASKFYKEAVSIPANDVVAWKFILPYTAPFGG